MYRAEPSPIAPLILAAQAGRVVAYARTDGRIVWSWSDGIKVAYPGEWRPTQMEIHGARVFVLVGRLHKKVLGDTCSAEITALDYDTGRVLWTQHVDRKTTGFRPTLFVDVDQVIVAHAGYLDAFAAGDGAPRWARRSEHNNGEFQPGLELGVPGFTARQRPSD